MRWGKAIVAWPGAAPLVLAKIGASPFRQKSPAFGGASLRQRTSSVSGAPPLAASSSSRTQHPQSRKISIPIARQHARRARAHVEAGVPVTHQPGRRPPWAPALVDALCPGASLDAASAGVSDRARLCARRDHVELLLPNLHEHAQPLRAARPQRRADRAAREATAEGRRQRGGTAKPLAVGRAQLCTGIVLGPRRAEAAVARPAPRDRRVRRVEAPLHRGVLRERHRLGAGQVHRALLVGRERRAIRQLPASAGAACDFG